jgi:hypothetical protein
MMMDRFLTARIDPAHAADVCDSVAGAMAACRLVVTGWPAGDWAPTYRV